MWSVLYLLTSILASIGGANSWKTGDLESCHLPGPVTSIQMLLSLSCRLRNSKKEILPYLFPPSLTETSLSWGIANGRAASKGQSNRELKLFVSELLTVPTLLSPPQFIGTLRMKENTNGNPFTSCHFHSEIYSEHPHPHGF